MVDRSSMLASPQSPSSAMKKKLIEESSPFTGEKVKMSREQREIEREKRRQEKKVLKIKKKKNTVSFKYDIKLAKIENQQDWGSWVSSLFVGKQINIKDLAKVEHVPAQSQVPHNEFHTTVQAGTTAFIQFKVFNRTDSDWDRGCFLINDFEGGIQKNFFEIRKFLKQMHMFFLEIQIFIPAIVQEQVLDVAF